MAVTLRYFTGGAYSYRPHSWILGGLLRRGGKGTREEGRGGEGRKGQEGEGEGRYGVGMGSEGAGSAPKLMLGPRTIFLAPALWKAHTALPISVN